MTDTPLPGAHDPDRISQSELDRLAFAVTDRFAPHLHAAQAAVREAEQGLTDAREALARAEQADADRPYKSDPLVFMRATVGEDVDGLARKTTPKKVRASFRYLLDRAVELANGEVVGYQNDAVMARRDRVEGVEACRQAVEVALADVEAARAMQQRVLAAEQAARDGLKIMRTKMGPDPT